jgi:hypothetical protein
MGLGRTTRFAPLPPGSRRISVMRSGTAGLKALAPSAALLADFQARKRALIRGGVSAGRAHLDAARELRYRDRFRREIRGRSGALAALRRVIARSRTEDLYLMCMCPWRTPGRACHTYLLLELAREIEPGVRLLPEPVPKGTRRAPDSGAARPEARPRPVSPSAPRGRSSR